MPVCRCSTLAVVLCFCLVATAAWAKQTDEGVPREQHSWGRFVPGSWKRVRARTEQLDEKQNVTSVTVTETTSKLVEVDDKGYLLMVDVVVEVAGGRSPPTRRMLRLGYDGENAGQQVEYGTGGSGVVQVESQEIPCTIREITVTDSNTKRVTTVHYNGKVAPYVLRRHSKTVTGETVQSTTDAKVVAIDMPVKVNSEMKTSHVVCIDHRVGNYRVHTQEYHCPDVPGSVVWHSSKEVDEARNIVRRSTLELVDYGLGSGENGSQVTSRPFMRAKNRRANR